MEKHDIPSRRVGTLTMGVVLVASGCAMLLGMFFPNLDLAFLLQLSPVILISLGVETLLASRRGGKFKYDWVGMILCCLLVCTALCFYAVAYAMVWCPEEFRNWWCWYL